MGNNISILIVDDEIDLTESLYRSIDLSADEYSFSISSLMVAGDGSEALSKLKNQHFDAVILDNDMPKKSGLEVLQYIDEVNKNDGPDIHVIFMSGKLDKDVVLQLKDLKIIDTLAKPFDVERILNGLHKIAMIK
jgi:CheY-like chemotaxis protein